MKKEKVNLENYFRIISLLGFFAIFMNSATGINVDKWVDGLLYVIIGIALMIMGSIHMFIKFFENGLDTQEIYKIITDLVGLFAFISGLSIVLEWDNPLLLSIRSIVAIFAIIIIVADFFEKKNGKKR